MKTNKQRLAEALLLPLETAIVVAALQKAADNEGDGKFSKGELRTVNRYLDYVETFSETFTLEMVELQEEVGK